MQELHQIKNTYFKSENAILRNDKKIIISRRYIYIYAYIDIYIWIWKSIQKIDASVVDGVFVVLRFYCTWNMDEKQLWHWNWINFSISIHFSPTHITTESQFQELK